MECGLWMRLVARWKDCRLNIIIILCHTATRESKSRLGSTWRFQRGPLLFIGIVYDTCGYTNARIFGVHLSGSPRFDERRTLLDADQEKRPPGGWVILTENSAKTKMWSRENIQTISRSRAWEGWVGAWRRRARPSCVRSRWNWCTATGGAVVVGVVVGGGKQRDELNEICTRFRVSSTPPWIFGRPT